MPLHWYRLQNDGHFSCLNVLKYDLSIVFFATHGLFYCETHSEKRCYLRKNDSCYTSEILLHYSDVIMSAMVSQITGVLMVCFNPFFWRRSKKAPIKALRQWPL